MALIVVESDAAQVDGRALSTAPFLPSCQLDGIVHAHWIPAWRGDDGWGAFTSNGYDDWGRLTT